jgi:MoaA/NifB/PqqE/SkfB family radical SAM enzyme
MNACRCNKTLPSPTGERRWRQCFKMTETLYAHIDEQGRLILPPKLVEEWGLSSGHRLPVESDGHGLRLRPPITSLRRVYVEITNRCNLNCSTCMRNVWDVEYGCMPAQTFERILSGIKTRSPKPDIFIGGYGEPLSHPDCLEMIEKAKSLGLHVSLITNGILLTEEVSRKLIELQLDRLWVSLDGASPECYADVRLGDALPVILENLNRLRTLQYQLFGFSPWGMLPRLGIAFVAMRRNIHDLPKVIQLGARLGAVEYSVSNVLAHNQSLNDEILYLRSLDEVNGRYVSQWKPLIHMPTMDINITTAQVMMELLNSANRLELMGSVLGRNSEQCPFVERGSLSIRWDGKVSPCLPLLYTHTHYLGERERTSREYFVGDIQAKELCEIWNDPAYLALRTRLQDFDFSPCTLCNSCEMADQNLEDCFGNDQPACDGCLWAQGLIRCP